ncbi:unnamed protein product, partial [Meganyctiphanes norvegica]
LVLKIIKNIVVCVCLRRNGSGSKENSIIFLYLRGSPWRHAILRKLQSKAKPHREGVRAKWINPLFPSLSLPTWTSFSTGLYPENHGIVGNYIYDPVAKDFFSLDDSESMGQQKWWEAEPIWVTATNQGVKTALTLWSQCHVSYGGVLPAHCKPYVYPTLDNPVKFQTLNEDITKAIENLEKGYDLVQVYCEQPDYAGHAFGPDGDEMMQTIRHLDTAVTSMMNQLEATGLDSQVNVLIVSDHGMTDVGIDKVQHVDLDQYLNADLVEKIADNGAFFNIKVPTENIEQVYTQLSSIPGAVVFRHDDIPDELHFKNHKYIHDFIVKTKPGYWITGSRNTDKMLPPEYHTYSGTHGYESKLQDMRGIFFAKGPDFENNKVIEAIDVVDVYQVLAHVLKVSPLPHNGTWSHVEPALRRGNSVKTIDYIVALKVMLGFLIFIVGALLYVYKRAKLHNE